MAYNGTIIIKDGQTGEALDFTKRILLVAPVLSKPSIVAELSLSAGPEDNLTGDILKTNKRTLKSYTATAAIGDKPAFAGATGQVVSKVSIPFTARQDNIVTDLQDVELIKTASGANDIVASDTANFMISWQEKDLNEGMEIVKTSATSNALYSSVAKVAASDLFATKPTGVQPTQPVVASAVLADYVSAINKGRRYLKIPSAILATDTDTRINFVRSAIAYLTNLGSPISVEQFYPYSINGIPLNDIRVITTYQGAINLNSKLVTTVLNLSNVGDSRNFNGLVSFIDTTPVYITNQLSIGISGYAVTSNRVLYRKPLNLSQIGTIKREAGAVVMEGGATKNVGPNEMLIQFDARVKLGALYFEEAFFIEEV